MSVNPADTTGERLNYELEPMQVRPQVVARGRQNANETAWNTQGIRPTESNAVDMTKYLNLSKPNTAEEQIPKDHSPETAPAPVIELSDKQAQIAQLEAEVKSQAVEGEKYDIPQVI